MTKQITKQILIILLACIAIVLILALIFYQYIPSNKIVPAKVQAYSTPESIKSEIEDSLNNQTLMGENELYEITDSDLDQYKSNRSYNPGKSDPFENYVEESEGSEETSSTTPQNKNASSSAQEKGNSNSSGNNNNSSNSNNNEKGSKVDANTTDNYYTASNVNKGTK